MPTFTHILREAQKFETTGAARDEAHRISEHIHSGYLLVSCIFRDTVIDAYVISALDPVNNESLGFYAKVQD